MKSQDLALARVVRGRNRDHEVLSAITDRYHAGRRAKADRGGFDEDREAPGQGAGTEGFSLREVYDFPIPSEAQLRALFQLTTAEAKLAQRLACGDSVEEVARKLSIKMTTARTQLAAIFAKTETRRQAKLVAILSRIAHLE